MKHKTDGKHRERRQTIQTIILAVLELACLWWILTHDAMYHPIENGVAAWLAFIIFPLLFLSVFEDKQPRHK